MVIIMEEFAFVKLFFACMRNFFQNSPKTVESAVFGRYLCQNNRRVDVKMRRYKLYREVLIFCIGGLAYCLIELLWRGRTHFSMFLLGGLCFYLIGGLNRWFRLSVLAQMLVSAGIITFLEFWTGVLVNDVLRLNVWDYSHVPLNFFGQICLPFTLLWFALSGVAIFAEDFIRHKLFHEPVPQYRWII